MGKDKTDVVETVQEVVEMTKVIAIGIIDNGVNMYAVGDTFEVDAEELAYLLSKNAVQIIK